MIGQLLDQRYQVLKVLGNGGFGQTYVAKDTRRPGEALCVVKHLKPAISNSKSLDNAKRAFYSEAVTLEKLGSHDQIPQLLAYFEENQEFYLVQEFVDGHCLSIELLPDQRWNESQVIELLLEVLGILEFIHSQGVIHRDIKPDNIIRRSRDRKLVLVDFGAVKQRMLGRGNLAPLSSVVRMHLATSQVQPSASVAIGTPGYMATEQGQGKARPNSDIYALGIIGIQALTGMSAVRLQILADPNTAELVWQNLVPVSPGLAKVLTKMVCYHFKDRYACATETLQALQQVPTSSYTPTQSAPPQQSKIQSNGVSTPLPPAESELNSSSNAIGNSKSATTTRQATSVNSPRQWLPLVGSGTAAVVIAISVTLAVTLLPKPDQAPVSTVSPSPNSTPKINPTTSSSLSRLSSTANSNRSASTLKSNSTANSNRSASTLKSNSTANSNRNNFSKLETSSKTKPAEEERQPQQTNPQQQEEAETQETQQPELETQQPEAEAKSTLESATAQFEAGNFSEAIDMLKSIPTDSEVSEDAQNLLESAQAALAQQQETNVETENDETENDETF